MRLIATMPRRACTCRTAAELRPRAQLLRGVSPKHARQGASRARDTATCVQVHA